jgi:hypothetical protein
MPATANLWAGVGLIREGAGTSFPDRLNMPRPGFPGEAPA